MDKKETQGLSLKDIAGFGEDVEIGNDKKLRVTGISAEGVLTLLLRYPDLQKWLGGQAIAVIDVMALAPDALAAIIAAGTGAPGDVDAEDIARQLPIEAQTDVIEAIYRQTFRSGFGPFVSRVLKLYDAARSSGNFGVDPATKSPQELKPSLPTDTTPPASGPTLPDK